ncbi:MAG TPA: hypothetical protein EYP56_22215 [Planctomycetaceae bacterium]|nr:hypothetical protein [Planctomycetaceae bacterium]
MCLALCPIRPWSKGTQTVATSYCPLRLAALTLAATLLVPPAGKGQDPASLGRRAERFLASIPHPRPAPPRDRAAVDRAIARGIQFLLDRQNKDGSWGSHYNTKGLNIYAPVPGAHHAFRGAVTALCISALIETGQGHPGVEEALDRAETWLFRNLPQLRRATPDAIYNTWGHAYAIQALVRMARRKPDDPDRQEKIRRLLRQQIELLGRYECVDGGWCYYDFNAHTKKPSGSSISFVSATVLVAFHEASQLGLDIPQRLVNRAMDSIRRQRKPDFSYCYGEYLKYQPMYSINRPGGSLGRSQACNLAMRLWGDRDVTDAVIARWLDRLFARNLWLDMGRKRPIPHESWFAVAGYFFYYGHYYAGLCIEQLPPEQRPVYRDHLAAVLLRLQEKDGSWWDFPLYDYHQQYGTAFALMSLARCRDGQ